MENRLQRVWNKVVNLWYTPYYLGLYWSQNYWLDTEKSDFDFKCIILPTLEDLVSQRKPVSKVLEFEWGQIDLKDIRTYIESAVKVNINFIEILSTEYYLWDANIRKFFTPLLDEMGWQYLRACLGMLHQKFHALKHPFPSKEYEIKTFWYDPKQLCHILRLRLLMQRYLKWNYNYSHKWIEKDVLINFKNWIKDLERAEIIAREELILAMNIVDTYEWEDVYFTKHKLIEFSRQVIIDNIRKNENFKF
jgi:hypothetical protein